MRIRGLGKYLPKILAWIIGAYYVIQICFDVVVILHNHSGALYEYVDYDWHLIARCLLCFLGLYYFFMHVRGLLGEKGYWGKTATLLSGIIMLFIIRSCIPVLEDRRSRSFDGQIEGLKFITDVSGFVFVNARSNGLVIYKTEDGGESWFRVISDPNNQFSNIYSQGICQNKNMLQGKIRCYDEYGFMDYERTFAFDVSTYSFSISTDSCLVAPPKVNEDLRREISTPMERYNYTSIGTVDSLNRFVYVHVFRPYATGQKNGLLYKSYDEERWRYQPLSKKIKGPISVTEKYVYSSTGWEIIKYRIDNNRIISAKMARH